MRRNEELSKIAHYNLQCIYPPSKNKLFLFRKNEKIALFISFRFVCPSINWVQFTKPFYVGLGRSKILVIGLGLGLTTNKKGETYLLSFVIKKIHITGDAAELNASYFFSLLVVEKRTVSGCMLCESSVWREGTHVRSCQGETVKLAWKFSLDYGFCTHLSKTGTILYPIVKKSWIRHRFVSAEPSVTVTWDCCIYY